MPRNTELDQKDLDEITKRIDEANSLRVLAREFKIGQGRIRRIWGKRGASYRAAYTVAPKVGVLATEDTMAQMSALAGRLEAEVKPWPATRDKVQGLPPCTDEEQVERYLASLAISHEASLSGCADVRALAEPL
jgi:hypothetical protein